jgi:hypothetical protein
VNGVAVGLQGGATIRGRAQWIAGLDYYRGQAREDSRTRYGGTVHAGLGWFAPPGGKVQVGGSLGIWVGAIEPVAVVIGLQVALEVRVGLSRRVALDVRIGGRAGNASFDDHDFADRDSRFYEAFVSVGPALRF